MNIQEAFEKVAGLLPGAERAQKLETDLAAALERITALEGKLSTAETSVADWKGKFEKAEADHKAAIEKLNADNKAALHAKEADVEKRAGLKAQAIAAGRGLANPPKDETDKGAAANGTNGETAFATYQRLMSEGKAAEAAKFYAENADEVLKTRKK